VKRRPSLRPARRWATYEHKHLPHLWARVAAGPALPPPNARRWLIHRLYAAVGGATDKEIAADAGVTRETVRDWWAMLEDFPEDFAKLLADWHWARTRSRKRAQ
jgi:hypothetical protein